VPTPTVKDIDQAVKQPDKLLTIKENATVTEAAKKMSDNKVGCLVVFDTQGKFTGILSERDMLEKVLTTSLSQDSALVRDIMTADPISCTMNTPIAKVERIMAEHKIRHLPIVENGVPMGMVSSRDTIAYHLHSNKAMKTAAEQLAMLSTGLKSLELDDVIELAINEVPKSFEAECAVLCITQKDTPTPMIHRKGCRLSRENLLDPAKMKQLSQSTGVILDNGCEACCQAPRLVIPLTIYEQSADQNDCETAGQGFLCMCRLNQSSVDSEQSQLYKASLLREVLNVNLTNAKLYQDYQKARHDSEIDPLTGVGTRRVLEKVLKTEYARATRYNRCYCVAIVDIDNFKEINDTAGHAAGDRALQQLAKIMRESVRTTDVIITRYGGDEFVLVMPETKIKGARVLLERLRRQVRTISIPKVKSVTISSGLAELTENDDTAESTLSRADEALYEAKRTGRNRVITSQSRSVV